MDLAAEREASRARREAARHEQRLRSRVRACRQELVAEDGHYPLNKRRPRTIEEAARMLWPNMPDEEVAAIVAAAEQPVDRGRPVTVLTTQQASLEAELQGDRWRVAGTISSEHLASFMRLVGAGVGG